MQPSNTATKCLTILNNITSMTHLQQLQSQMTKLSLDQNPLAMSKLISFSSTTNNTNYSCSLLSHFTHPTTFLWNALIRGFSQSQHPHNSFTWYSKMTNSGTSPDNFTFPFLLKSCSRLLDLGLGFQFHTHIIKFGLLLDPYVGSSLVYLYTSCGELGFARNVFDEMPIRNNVVIWNVMVSGCVRSGGVLVKEGLEYFQRMRVFCTFDEYSLVSVSSACAGLGAGFLGKGVHGLACRSGFCEVVPLGNALVDMYGKCGSIIDARKLFEEMSVKDIVSWSTMIDVLAMHGCGSQAAEVFAEMETVGIVPDETAFTSLLCACSHAGLLYEGKMWFGRMRNEYGVRPKIQHYGCMVDLLGKAGKLEEAYELIREMPIETDAAIWRSMVGACLYHCNLDLAEVAASRLISFGLDDSGDTVILSNVYSKLRKWKDVERVRRGNKKTPGHSFIEVDNVVHEFFIKDNLHPQIDDIYLLVKQMTGQFKLFGCV